MINEGFMYLAERGLLGKDLQEKVKGTSTLGSGDDSGIKLPSHGDFGSMDQYTLASLYSKTIRVQEYRDSILKDLRALKNHWLASSLIDRMLGDSLARDVQTGEVFTLSYEGDSKKSKILEDMEERLNLDMVVSNIVEDLLHYGEYPLSVVVEPGKGIVEIKDDLEVHEVVALYEGGYPILYFVRPNGRSSKVKVIQPSEIVHFCLRDNKVKVSLPPNYSYYRDPEKLEDRFYKIRIGRSVLFPALEKLKEYRFMELLRPALMLTKLASAKVIGVNMPQSSQFSDIVGMIQSYEKYLNIQSDKMKTKYEVGDMDISDLLKETGRWKVVPILGDKGRMELQDVRQEDTGLREDLREMRDEVSIAVGVPPILLFAEMTGDTHKADVLKQYGRYVKKLKSIQNAISAGLRNLAVIHLRNSGITDIVPSKIQTSFTSVVDVEDLDKMEFTSAAVDILSTMLRFLGDLDTSAEFKGYTNPQGFIEFARKCLSNLGGAEDIISKVKREVETPPTGTTGGFGL
jgi:hypothetical protein